jgi:hypothetical protein
LLASYASLLLPPRKIRERNEGEKLGERENKTKREKRISEMG